MRILGLLNKLNLRVHLLIVSLGLLLNPSVLIAAFLPPVMSSNGMVVTEQYLASEVGANILRQGGNAMDAAVAVAYALAVVDPCCGNIGGGGFMLVHWHNGENLMLDFREVAPKNIRPDLFFQPNGAMKSPKELGYLTVGVPGTVMGLNTALQKYGTLSLNQVMAPAIQLAKSGFVLDSYDVAIYAKAEPIIRKSEQLRKIYMPDGHLLQVGQRLIQKELAATLEKIRDYGTDAFYRGDIARQIVESSQKNHGVFTLDDFKNYHVVWRQPLSCLYHGYQIVTGAPPSSGVAICQILQTVEKYPLDKIGYSAAQGLHYNLSAMDFAFRDRDQYLGDPAFIKNPISELLSTQHIQSIQHEIEKNKMLNMPRALPLHDSLQTTHFVVMDKEHNVVSTTFTLNSLFGVGMVAGNTGFILNNELDDFTLKIGQPNQFNLLQGKANLIAGGKRPLSSMSPTIVLRDNQVFMALGAAGGSTIITSIVEAIENVIDYKMDIVGAINSPRYHTQYYPNVVFMEPFAFSPDTMHLLKHMNYNLQQGLFGHFAYWGQVAALLVDSQGTIEGANDYRRPNGRAVGLAPSLKKNKPGNFLQ